MSSAPATQSPIEPEYELIEPYINGAKAGGDPIAVSMATSEVEPSYINTAAVATEGGDEPEGHYEKPHVSTGML